MAIIAPDIGIDLGTSNTLVYVKHKGVVLNEPTLMVVTGGQKKSVKAFGEDARLMLGRTTGEYQSVRPLEDGVIKDYDMTEYMLEFFIRKAIGMSRLVRPRGLITIPSRVTAIERRAVREAAENAGIRKGALHLIEKPFAAALGSGSLRSGDMADGIGSAECISAVLPDENVDFAGMFRYNICAEPYAVPGKYLALIFSNTAGAALKWYRDTFERELRAKCDAAGKNTYAELNKSLSDAPSPLLFLPHLAGTGTPYMDSGAKGAVMGLTLASSKMDLYRAIIEGNNYEMRYNLELLSRFGMKFDALTAVGGGASPEALRIKADIFQKPIYMLNTSQGGTVGMVVLCGKAAGQFASFEEGVASLVRKTGCVEPDPKYRDRYDEKYAQYKRMYEAARSVYADGE